MTEQPDTDRDRLEALRSLQILDTPPEPAFDAIARLAAEVCGTPIALISFVDAERQWFKAAIGTDLRETPVGLSICARAIREPGLFVLEDARRDPRFADGPLVTGAFGLRFYAGAPILSRCGHRLGMICTIDTVPRSLDPGQEQALATLAAQVETLLGYRRALAQETEDKQRLESQRRDLDDLNTRLRRAVRDAEQANRMKTAFLANMSHELRTPLNAIMGFSELMVTAAFGPLPARYQDYAGDILNSGRHLLAVINDVLDIARIECGDEVLWESVVCLPQLAHSAVSLVREKARAGEIEMVTAIAADLPPVRGDERRLRQMLLNLLANAVEATPPGGIVTLFAEAAADTGIVLGVRDTGRGMKEAQIAAVQEPFGRPSASIRGDGDGAGLGLPLTRRLVEMHGGALDLSSRPGQGTTALLFLPADRVVETAPA